MARKLRWSQNWTICALAFLTAGVWCIWEYQSPSNTFLTVVVPGFAKTTYVNQDSVCILLGSMNWNSETTYHYQPSYAGRVRRFDDRFDTYKFHIHFYGIDFAYGGYRGTPLLGFALTRTWLFFPIAVLIVGRIFEYMAKR
jgi:hypothetical protein